MPIYDRPTKELMREFVEQEIRPGQVFDKQQAVRWFQVHYPKIRATTVQMHVEGMAVNSSTRQHHPSIRPGSGYDLFFKIAPGRFRLWEQATDPEPLYREPLPESPDNKGSAETEDEEVDGSREFAYERDLRSYLAKNLGLLERDLTLYKDEELSGVEFPVGGRFIDILARDADGHFVVIELKVSRGYDRVIGQLLRYMAWVKRNMADDKKVRGFIIASDITEDLKLAASLISDVALYRYELALKLFPVGSASERK